jgi:hypothetical protein
MAVAYGFTAQEADSEVTVSLLFVRGSAGLSIS